MSNILAESDVQTFLFPCPDGSNQWESVHVAVIWNGKRVRTNAEARRCAVLYWVQWKLARSLAAPPLGLPP